MRKIVSLLLCLALIAGIMPLAGAQASDSGPRVPGLVSAQVLNSCQIVLVFDQAITYAGGEWSPLFLVSEIGEFPPIGGGGGMQPVMPPFPGPWGGACGLGFQDGDHAGITVASPGGNALAISAVISLEYGLLLMLDQPLAGQERLDISIDEGVVQFLGSEELFDLNDYRVMTPLGTLELMNRLDPQHGGFQVGHAVKYMKGADSESVTGTAGLNQQDARFLLSLIESGPVDKSELTSLVGLAKSLLESGDGYPVDKRRLLQAGLDSANVALESGVASYREVRAQTVGLERAAVAFAASYEELEPPMPPKRLAPPLMMKLAEDSVIDDGVFNIADQSLLTDAEGTAAIEVELAGEVEEEHAPYEAGDRVVVRINGEWAGSYELTAADIAGPAPDSFIVAVDVSGYMLGINEEIESTYYARAWVESAGSHAENSDDWYEELGFTVDLKAPTVMGVPAQDTPYNGTLTFSSDEAGMVFLVPNAEDISGLENLYVDGEYRYPYRSADYAGASLSFNAEDWLQAGTYKLIAVDWAGNLSAHVPVTITAPPAELTAEIGNYGFDGWLHPFNITFNEPIILSVRQLESGVVDRVELHYASQNNPLIVEGSEWSLFWENDHKTLNLHNDEGVDWMGVESVTVHFVDNVLVSESGARYPVGTPLNGLFYGPDPEFEEPNPLYVKAGAGLFNDGGLYSFNIRFWERLKSSGHW